jgi:iduronate 2-sulfatase
MRSKPTVLVGAFVLALACATPALATHYNVVLLAGQSNMGGKGQISGLTPPLASPQADVQFYYNSDDVVHDTANESSWVTLRPGGGQQFGPEVAFGRTVADALPSHNLALIKSYYGGTNLSNHWNPPSGFAYTIFKNTVSAALTDLTNASHTYTITGMLWTQGETDANGTRTTAQYQTDLNELIADVRSNYGADLPFFISRLADTQTHVSMTAKADIRSAQENVAAADPFAFLIDTDGFSVGDTLHFSTAGQIQLGTAFGQSYIANIPEPSSLVLAAMGLGAFLRLGRRRLRRPIFNQS